MMSHAAAHTAEARWSACRGQLRATQTATRLRLYYSSRTGSGLQMLSLRVSPAWLTLWLGAPTPIEPPFGRPGSHDYYRGAYDYTTTPATTPAH